MRAIMVKAGVAAALVLPSISPGATAAAAEQAMTAQASARATAAAAANAVTAASNRVAALLAQAGNDERPESDQRSSKRSDRRVNRADLERVRAAASANPAMDEVCGLDATLTLDSSGSIGGASNQVRTAASDFLVALKDTNSTLRITSFSDRARQLAPRSPVNAATTGPGGVLSQGVANYPAPSGGTNWMESLDFTNTGDVAQPELLIFVTDGDPTRWTNSDGSLGGTGMATASNIANSLARAISAADRVKARNTRILVVGVGDGLDNAQSQARMKDISGPQLVTSPSALAGKDINDVDAVAFTNFAALGSFLRSVVTSLCGNSVTVQKLAQSSSNAAYLPATGWNVTVRPIVTGGVDWIVPDKTPAESKTVATSGDQGTAAFQWDPRQPSNPTTVQVSEDVKSGFTANRWECDVKRPDGSTTTVQGNLTRANPQFSFPMVSEDVASCRLYNDFDYAPGLAVTKAAADDPIRGNAAGWDETYTFRVTNTGNATLNNVKPIDPKCQATMSGPTGPGAASGNLQPGDTWTFTCTRHIFRATTTEDIEESNTAHAIGSDPTGKLVQANPVTETVAIKTPAIQVVKSATDAFGDPIGPDTVVPAGSLVTYSYTVTNTGNDTLQDITIADDKCSPITGPTGDGNGNRRLETTETWTYQCSKKLLPPSTDSAVHNTVLVSGRWSNPQDRAQNNTPVVDTDSMTIKVASTANLTIVKHTVPGDDQTEFDFTVAGNRVPPNDTEFSLASGGSRSMVVEPLAGSSEYTITEAGAGPTWDRISITCVNDDTGEGIGTADLAAGTAVVPLEAEDSVTCTFVNGRRPRLTVEKSAPGAGDLAFDFTATGVSPDSFSLGNGESRDFPNAAPGTVTVTEGALPAGWRLDGIVCDSGSWTVTGAQVSIELDYDQDVACSFNNSRIPPATLTVVKTGTGGVPSPDFAFTVSGTGTLEPGEATPPNAEFELPIGGSHQLDVWPAEGAPTEYTVTEATPPAPDPDRSGFELTGIQCIVDGNTGEPVNGTIDADGSGDVVVPLEPGDDAVCTFTNELRPRLTILKSVTWGVGQTGATFDFFGDGVLSNITLPDEVGQTEGTHVYANLDPQEAFSLTEFTPADWEVTEVTCSGPGAERVSANRGLRTISSDGLAYGDDVTCYFANTKNPLEGAHLIVTKIADPTAGAPAFDFTASGVGIETVGQQGSVDFSLDPSDPAEGTTTLLVHPGEGGDEYTVSEADQPGWNLRSLQCARPGVDPVVGDPGERSVAVTLLPGQTAVCTFDNQRPGTLTVTKQTDTPTARQFAFGVTGGLTPASFSLGAGGSRQFDNIAGSTEVTITENVPGGDSQVPDRWQLADITCTGTAAPPSYDLATGQVTVTVGAGEDVHCVYSDAQVPPAVLTVQKAADPSDTGQDFDFTLSGNHGGVLPADQEFSLVPNGDVAARVVDLHPPVGGEQYNLAELVGQLPPRWQLLEVQCRGAFDLDATEAEVAFILEPGQTATCTFFDQRSATLTVAKSAPDNPALAFPFQWSPTPDVPFSLTDGQSTTAENLAPGSAWVQEDPAGIPPDWFLAGGHPVCTGTAAAAVYDRELGADLDIAAGEDAFCTFANFYDYRPAIQLDKEPNRETVLPGGAVTYDYALTNVGNTPIPRAGLDPDEIVVDDRCEPVIRLTGDDELDVGETWTFSCATTLTADTRNVATATMTNPVAGEPDLSSTDEASVDVVVPALTVDKRPSHHVVYPGTSVTYTYEVRNTGETPLRNVVLTDDRCSPLTLVSGDDGDGVLQLPETWTYECTMVVNETTTNTVTAGGDGFIEGFPEELYPVSDTDTRTVPVIVRDVTVTKSASARGGVLRDGVLVFPAGERVTYRYEVTSGAATMPMEVLSMTDNRCSPLRFVSGDSNGNGLVDPGETWHYECAMTVEGAQRIDNTVSVVAVEPILGGISDDSAEASVASVTSGIQVRKSVDRDIVPPGRTVVYTYQVTNTGTDPLSNVTVTDNRCSPVTYRSGDVDNDKILQVGEIWIYTCATAVSTSVTNVVVARGVDSLGATVSSTATAFVQVLSPASLDARIRVVKDPSKTKVKKGERVTYTYTVTNPGRVPLANVKTLIRDDKCSPVAYVSGDIDGNNLLTSGRGLGEYPKETWIFTCTTKLRKTTTNTVVVGGTPFFDGERVGPRVDDSDQAKVRVPGTPDKPDDPDNKHKKDHDDGRPDPGEDPSFTGADVLRLLLLALAALVTGGLFVGYARRGRRSL